jgi:hypothetical protein
MEGAEVSENEAEALAGKFHEAYERLAPQFGYTTRRESAVPWEQVPEQNRKLMTAVCGEVMSDALAKKDEERAGLLVDYENMKAKRDALQADLATARADLMRMREERGKDHESLTEIVNAQRRALSRHISEAATLRADLAAKEAFLEDKTVRTLEAEARVKEAEGLLTECVIELGLSGRLRVADLVDRVLAFGKPEQPAEKPTACPCCNLADFDRHAPNEKGVCKNCGAHPLHCYWAEDATPPSVTPEYPGPNVHSRKCVNANHDKPEQQQRCICGECKHSALLKGDNGCAACESEAIDAADEQRRRPPHPPPPPARGPTPAKK